MPAKAARLAKPRKPAPERATYLYCVARGVAAPRLGGVTGGLAGTGRPRAIDGGGGYWLVVADAPLARYGSAPIEAGLKDLDWVSACAVAHESVIEKIARQPDVTVVPLKLFTLFASDERALAHVRRMRRRLDRVVARVAGCAEWSLRVRFDAARVARQVQEEARSAAAGRSPGMAFLLRKKKEQEAAQRLRRGSRSEALAIADALAAHARDEVRKPVVATPESGSLLLVDAVYLVPHRVAHRFAEAARAEARKRAGDGFQLSLSGPWPPYHFVTT